MPSRRRCRLAWADAGTGARRTGSAGIGMAGGFGTGKSHLLGYLAEVARQQGFVVSRVVVSKETPLSHPGTCSPPPCAMRRCRIGRTTRSPPASPRCANGPRRWTRWTSPSARRMPAFAPIFAACLFLVRRASTPPETLRRIARLWSGAKVSAPAIRQALDDVRVPAGCLHSSRSPPRR